MHILVTGGAGFIGSHLVDALVQNGHRVRIFDALANQVHQGTTPDYLNPAAEFIQGDVRDYSALRSALDDIEIVYHQTAAVGVGQSQYQIKEYMDVNVGGTSHLLDIIVNHKNHRVQKIIVAASMSSYGEGHCACQDCGEFVPGLRPVEQMARGDWEIHCPHCDRAAQKRPTPETRVQHSSSIYAISKKTQEEMVLNIGQTYNIPSVALRYFNVYGPRQSLSNPYTGVAAIFLSRIKNDHAPIVYEDGKQTRDFINVRDIVRANLLALNCEEAHYRALNIGTGHPLSIQSIAEALNKLSGKNIAPQITCQYRKGDIRHCYADMTSSQRYLGFKAEVPFEDGMRELMEWSHGATSVDKVDQAVEELKSRGLA